MRRKIIDIEITCKYFSEKALAYFSRISTNVWLFSRTKLAEFSLMWSKKSHLNFKLFFHQEWQFLKKYSTLPTPLLVCEMHKLNGVTDKMYSCYEEGMKAKGESYVYLCCKNANDLNISEKRRKFSFMPCNWGSHHPSIVKSKWAKISSMKQCAILPTIPAYET